jgi:hypothetical protein
MAKAIVRCQVRCESKERVQRCRRREGSGSKLVEAEFEQEGVAGREDNERDEA